MNFLESFIKGVFTIELTPFIDSRGWFTRTFCKNEFQQIGHSAEWVQLNHSFTATNGTIRGMHFQEPPFSETKLVRCIAGNVFDVVVDLRKNSPTFLKWFGVELSAENRKMIYIPEGLAHGFQALTNNCELVYHHSAFYTPNAEKGLRYNDQMINITWKLPAAEISERDKSHELLTNHFNGI